MIRISVSRRKGVAVALSLVLGCLAGCGGKPVAFPTPDSELGNRPGLFTGDQGSWDVLSRSPTTTPTH